MKSRGPNVSVLHLRSTSEPWASDTDDERLVFDSVKLNCGMDYENFFKSYAKHNQFAFDNGYVSTKREQPASPSPTRCRSRASSTTSAVDAATDVGYATLKYYPHLKNGVVGTEGCRREVCEPVDSPRRLSRERDQRVVVKQHRDADAAKLCSNYPIISPPPGFEDDVLFKENSNQCFLRKNARDYSPALRSSSSPYREEYPSRSSIYRKNAANFQRKKDRYHCSYYDAASVPASNEDTTGGHFANNSNFAYSRHNYRTAGYGSPNSQEVLERRRVNSSPDYYYYDDEMDYCRLNHDPIISGHSYSMDQSSHPSYTSHCDRCCAPLSSLPVHNNVIIPQTNGHRGAENENCASMVRNSPLRQRIRRSASFQNGCANPLYVNFQNGCSNPLYVNVNNYGHSTVQSRNAEFRRRRPLYSTVDDQFHESQIYNTLEDPVSDACRFYGCENIENEPVYRPNDTCMYGHNLEELRKKSCSLPKSFQRIDELNKDFKLPATSTLFFHWRKYGFRGLFLNKKSSAPSSIMSETAPTTPVKDMPEKKKYGRLMKIGQYSSSPALDDDSIKHINFDCDTKYKMEKYKRNHPATLNTTDFRPSSQENIVSGSNLGDKVFHKFCKSFSLRFLKKPADHDADALKTSNDCSPCAEKIICEPGDHQIHRSGPLTWRSNSDRSRRLNTTPNKTCKSRGRQNSSESQPSGENEVVPKTDSQQRLVRRTLSDLNQYCTTLNDKNVNVAVPTKHKALVPVIAKKYKQCSLRRSASQPLLNSKHSPAIERKPPPCRTACSEDERALFSEDDMMSDSGSSLPSRKNSLEQGINEDVVIFAEAVWDHVAIESEELPFNAGDVIEVYNVLDREWWWGMCNGKSGWFPSDFVRLRVNQEESLQNHLSESPTKLNSSLSTYSNEQVRSKIICELLNTEKDFVKVLNDVKEAFIAACQNAKELFTAEQIYKIFGNWEHISVFQATFLENLEASFNEQHPHLSCVGECFLKFREHFRIYSDYCNNHPLSIATLQQLYQKEEYKHFLESCRVKKNLIAISLDGFLLTPVQRICKYPLQLAELLKYTESEHADHNAVEDALNAMREVAILINERKRRMESLEKLVLWQQRVEGWEGNNLIENSSQLVHQSDITKVFAEVWSTNVTLFLFDHQLIFCKKDILKRDFYVYKGRISLDGCEVIDISDGKDTLLGINIRNGLRIQNVEKNKWLLFCCRTQREKLEWLNAFRKEKELVQLDERNKLQITPMDRQLAYITATTCNNSRHVFLNHKNKKFKRTISHNGQFRNAGSPHILGRKVGTWFMFGANRKNHRRFISKNHSNAV